jgi:Tol biopolymer transport system component
MRQTRIRVGALTIALSVAGVAWWQGPAQASYPGENGLIAWTRPGFLVDSEIWVMNPNGSAQRALTDNASNDADPAWSADGSKLVFESVTGNAFNLYVINADGTDLHQLTTSTNRTDVQPAWSPDGTKVAFSRQKMDGTGAIWIIDDDGTNLHRITGEGSQNAHPNWSPDGSLIVFESDRSGGHDLYTMTPGGQNKTNITNTLDVQEGNPNWSPDGTQIAFDSCPAPSYPCPGNADYNVFVIDADGTGLRQLTTSTRIDQNPAWSPNGRQIVFRSDATGNTEIFAMRVDGSEMRKLTSGLNGGVDPDWQPLPT